jgi:biopolymer transport protein ExbD
MSSSAGFKQLCPRCQVPLLLRDASWVGKTVECPKCQHHFVVADPARATPPDKQALIRKDQEAVSQARHGGAVPGEMPTSKSRPARATVGASAAVGDPARFTLEPLATAAALPQGSGARRVHRKKAAGEEGGVNLGIIITPMLDMAFQLLAFFVMTYHPSALEAHIDGNLLPPAKIAIKGPPQPPDKEPPTPVDVEPDIKDVVSVLVKAVTPKEQEEGRAGTKYKDGDRKAKMIVRRVAGDPSRVLLKRPESPEPEPVMDTDVILEEGLDHLGKVLKTLQGRPVGSKVNINIEADGDVKHEWVVRVYDEGRRAGFQNVGFVAPADAVIFKKEP